MTKKEDALQTSNHLEEFFITVAKNEERFKILTENIGKLAITPGVTAAIKSSNQMAEAAINLSMSPSFKNIMINTNKLVEQLGNVMISPEIETILKRNNEIAIAVGKIATSPSFEKHMRDIGQIIESISKLSSGIYLNPNLENLKNKESTIDTLSQVDYLSKETRQIDLYEFKEDLSTKEINSVFQEEGFFDRDITLEFMLNRIDEHFEKQEERKQKNNGFLNTTKKDFIMSLLRYVLMALIVPWFYPATNSYTNFANQKSTEIVKMMNNDIKATNSIDDYKHFRIVKKDDLKVKLTNKQNSITIYTINTGDIVEITYKKRNWSKIKIYNGNELVEGWVYTRYIEKID